MRAIRGLLMLAGIGCGLWGAWLMRDFASAKLVSAGIWLAGGVILHDAILAPITIGLGLVAARVLPRHYRAAAGVAFLVWGTLTIAFFNVLSGNGGKPDNTSILGRPYVLSWLVLTGLLAVVAVIVAERRRVARA